MGKIQLLHYAVKPQKNFFSAKKCKKTKTITYFKDCASTYNIDMLNSFNSELQLKTSESAIENKLKGLLPELRGFKFVTALLLEFKETEIHDATKYSTFHLNSKAETTINGSNIDNAFKLIYGTIMPNIQKSLGKGLGCIIDSVVDHIIVISKSNPLPVNSYIKSPKELYNTKKVSLIFKMFMTLNAVDGVWSDICPTII